MIKCVACDSNADLVNVYHSLRDHPEQLISLLTALRDEFFSLDQVRKKVFFMQKRQLFNSREIDAIHSAALFIFLMTNCFNGIYSINRKGEMSVTFGPGRNTEFADARQLRHNSELLQGVRLLAGDYTQTGQYAGQDAFFYFDPPYKPVGKSQNYTSYMPDRFTDNEQIRLAQFCREIESCGAK